MIEYYNYIKSLHLIFIITWFSGLFYIPRIFIYHIEAQEKSDVERDALSKQLKIMAKRLWYIITWPSAILASIFAFTLIYLVPSWLTQQWMLIKLFLVGILYLYHYKTHRIFIELQQDKFQYSSFFMRIWNEGATLILFAIVFIAILKTSFHWIIGVLSILGLAVLLILGIRIYKRFRKQ